MVEDALPLRSGGVKRTEEVVEVGSAGDTSGSVELIVGSEGVKTGMVAPLVKDRDECWVCQVL